MNDRCMDIMAERIHFERCCIQCRFINCTRVCARIFFLVGVCFVGSKVKSASCYATFDISICMNNGDCHDFRKPQSQTMVLQLKNIVSGCELFPT